MMNTKLWVVKVSLKGHLFQLWLSEEGNLTSILEKAKDFHSVKDAYIALNEILNEEGILGFEVIFRGLCYPNPF